MIIKNAIRCNICGDEIESKHRHDFVQCKCGACAVDGGHDVASIPLDEYLQQEIATINELLEYNVCDKAVVLVDVNNIENIDIAKQDNRFLIYDDNREEVIKTFCNNNLK